jgi:mRNA interferase RelE/StbE
MSFERISIYKIRLSKRTTKFLSKLDKNTATRILDKIESLKADPYRSPGVKQLTGKLEGLYRLRIGNYRAVYEVNEKGHIIIVLIVGPRGDIYSKVYCNEIIG